MSRITEAFKKHPALITYITAGDPTLAATEQLIYGLEKAGADIIELGIPFSDPLADGPVIQASHQRALKNNVSIASVLGLMSKIRKNTFIPICFMLSFNLIVQYGEEAFYQDCSNAGVDGVIIPDLPPEACEVRGGMYNVDTIFLVAPTSSEERIKLAVNNSKGFVYLIMVKGITGARKGTAGNYRELIQKVKSFSNLPVAVGFGISTPQQARELSKTADGVIVGSAIVELVGKKQFKKALALVAGFRRALNVK